MLVRATVAFTIQVTVLIVEWSPTKHAIAYMDGWASLLVFRDLLARSSHSRSNFPAPPHRFTDYNLFIGLGCISGSSGEYPFPHTRTYFRLRTSPSQSPLPYPRLRYPRFIYAEAGPQLWFGMVPWFLGSCECLIFVYSFPILFMRN